MRPTIISIINDALANRKDFFIREQDIQLYLANQFINSQSFDNVFIEYYVPGNLIKRYLKKNNSPNYSWIGKNILIDIVLEKNNLFYPIEIKYKTTTQALQFNNIFGQKGIPVTLGQHGGQNIGCYDFWKDIKRVELFEEIFPNVVKGVVLFASNDPTYRNAPLDPKASYAQFSIHDGRKVSVSKDSPLDWNNGSCGTAKGRPAIHLIHDYNIVWTQMKQMQQIQDLYYILT